MGKDLEKLLKYEKNVEMIYVSGKDKITKRVVRIYTVNEKEIIGYCHLRGEVRTFKVERVLAVLPSKKFRIEKKVTS